MIFLGPIKWWIKWANVVEQRWSVAAVNGEGTGICRVRSVHARTRSSLFTYRNPDAQHVLSGGSVRSNVVVSRVIPRRYTTARRVYIPEKSGEYYIYKKKILLDSYSYVHSFLLRSRHTQRNVSAFF